jgi:hypothetical protein
MALLQQASPPQQCPRCRGQVCQDYDGDYCCLLCGEYIYFRMPTVRWQDLQPAAAEPGKRKRGRPRKHPIAA